MTKYEAVSIPITNPKRFQPFWASEKPGQSALPGRKRAHQLHIHEQLCDTVTAARCRPFVFGIGTHLGHITMARGRGRRGGGRGRGRGGGRGGGADDDDSDAEVQASMGTCSESL